MGRRAGKLKVEFIDNQKRRSLVFKRRKDSVKKMIKELSTLCDVKAGMILFDPGHDSPPADALWPPNDPAQVRGLIQEYKGDEATNQKNKSQKQRGLDDADQQQFGLGNSSMYPIVDPIGVYLHKKSELVRARIDWLKSQRELMDGDADQFVPNFQEEEMPREQAQLVIDDQFHHQQDQFVGHIFDLDDFSYQEDSSSNYGYNYDFGPVEEDSVMMPFQGNYYPQQQHQYELFGPVVNLGSSCQEEACSSTAMVMPDQMMDDALCGMGFDEHTSRETAAADDDFFDDGGLVTQLYTPPRPPTMTWQSTDNHLEITQMEDKGAANYLHCIDFSDLWV